MNAERKEPAGLTPDGADPRAWGVKAGQDLHVQPPGAAPPEGVSCEVCLGVPLLHGDARGYYVSRAGGRRMLVLSRRPGERMRINDTIDVVVLAAHNGRVELGIEPVS